MVKVGVDVRELRNKNGNEAVEDLKEFLKGRLGVEVEASGDLLSAGIDEAKEEESKGKKQVSRSNVRMLVRKFLHKTELKEDFRVITGKEGALLIKERIIVVYED